MDNKKNKNKAKSVDPTEEIVSTRFHLSGDFASPLELLAEDSLSNSQKREVLKMWLGETSRHGSSPELIELREQIEKLIAELPQD